jgi:hypothetical protein
MVLYPVVSSLLLDAILKALSRNNPFLPFMGLLTMRAFSQILNLQIMHIQVIIS